MKDVSGWWGEHGLKKHCGGRSGQRDGDVVSPNNQADNQEAVP